MICTIYSHHLVFDQLLETLQKHLPKATLTQSQQDGSRVIEGELKGGLFSSSQKFRVTYRERAKPSYLLPEADDSPLTRNLKGLYGYVASLPSSNERIQNLLLQKIQTLNCEFAIVPQQGELKELYPIIRQLASDADAILFVQPNTPISKSDTQHLLDKNLNLIQDGQGNCEIEELSVSINPEYFDQPAAEVTQTQKRRKEKSEQVLELRKIKLNRNLPCVEDEENVTLRTPEDIARRAVILAVTNLVAFGNISGEEAIGYLSEYELLDFVTANEKDFLEDPTEEKKNYETWKCECIWTLMWALKYVPDLGFPDSLCDLNNVPPDVYPVGPGKDPNEFIANSTSSRSIAEILDANDLYYRLDWACVDARINQRQIEGVHPGVVYERHYALNWLIQYMDQDWDDVSCDT